MYGLHIIYTNSITVNNCHNEFTSEAVDICKGLILY